VEKDVVERSQNKSRLMTEISTVLNRDRPGCGSVRVRGGCGCGPAQRPSALCWLEGCWLTVADKFHEASCGSSKTRTDEDW
jgi:hypothetical protein